MGGEDNGWRRVYGTTATIPKNTKRSISCIIKGKPNALSYLNEWYICYAQRYVNIC
jgi:hypothetical protein